MTHNSNFLGSSLRAAIFCLFVVTVLIGSTISVKANPYPIKVVGHEHFLVLMSDGTVIGWGESEYGQLGPMDGIPKIGRSAAAFVSIKLPRKAIDIAAGADSSFALLDDGTIVGWGLTQRQRTDTGTAGNQTNVFNGKKGSEKPLPLIGNLSDIMKISVGYNYLTALRRDGTVYAWTQPKEPYIELNPPKKLKQLKDITQISNSGTHSMALDKFGQVWTWNGCCEGEFGGYHGALGRMSNQDNPEKVAGLSDVISISAGRMVSTAVKKDGTVWVWGSNAEAQFGNGKRTDEPVRGGLSNKIFLVPEQVPGVQNAVYVTCGFGGRDTIALLKDGTLRGWGNTDYGQLGVGISARYLETPVTPKITGVKAIFTVHNNSFAIKNDNSFWIWGGTGREPFPLEKQATIPVRLELFRITPSGVKPVQSYALRRETAGEARRFLTHKCVTLNGNSEREL